MPDFHYTNRGQQPTAMAMRNSYLSAQSEKAQHCNDHNYETNDIDDVVHAKSPLSGRRGASQIDVKHSYRVHRCFNNWCHILPTVGVQPSVLPLFCGLRRGVRKESRGDRNLWKRILVTFVGFVCCFLAERDSPA